MITTRSEPGAREQFIKGASLEGITFSPEVRTAQPFRGPRLSFAAAGVGVLGAVVVAVLYVSHHLSLPSRQFDLRGAMQARQQIEHLTQQNSTLEATISRLEQTSVEQQREAESLRTQVATLTAAASNNRHDNDQTRVDTAQSRTHTAPFLEESEAQRKTEEKQLADTRAE